MPAKALTLGRPVYRGYMPIDLPQHRPRNPIKPWWKVLGKPRVTIYPKQEPEEWAEEAEYPPLNDATPNGLRRQPRLDWYETLKALPTAEQKLHEISRHATHYIAHLNNWIPVHNSLPAVQYMTRTHFINRLPDSYYPQAITPEDESRRELITRIKELLLNQLAIEKYETQKLKGVFISKSIRDGNRSQYIEDSLVQALVNSLRRALAPDVNQQLLEYQIDQSPSIRSWWYHSGYAPPNKKPYYKSRMDTDGNISQMIQVDGRSAMNFRSEFFIEPQLDLNDELVTNTTLIQDHIKTLKHYGAIYKFKWPVALPGFWFEDQPRFDCPHTCFLTTDALGLRNGKYRNISMPLNDTEDALNCQAILTAFSWLNSMSMYHGFTPFHEVDYPFTCQVITTDGQNWLFNVFQMNSHTFHRDLGGPKRNNICWSSGLMKLYENYDEHGRFVGLDDRVLDLIIRFFAQQTSPAYTKSLNLRPYLGEDIRSEEEKDATLKHLRRCIEGRTDRHKARDWFVPMFEHIYFRSPEVRGQIKHMKPRWHMPKPKTPRIFE